MSTKILFEKVLCGTYAWPKRVFPWSNSRIGSETPGGPPALLPAAIAMAIFTKFNKLDEEAWNKFRISQNKVEIQ